MILGDGTLSVEEEAFKFYHKYMKHGKQTESALQNKVKDA